MAARAVGLPTGVPPLAPERPVKWPKRTRARLSNGLEVILAEARSIPKFHGELFFRSGNAAVVHRAPGLAEMTATVARTATTKRASRQLEEDLRRIGADLSSSAGADISAIGFSGLAEFAEPLLELVNELGREAAFPVAQFERERRQKLEEVKMQRTEPGFLANERLRKVLFGAHPYAQVSPSEAQVAAYQREDLSAVYREFYTPENGALLLVGDFDANEMLPAAEKVFGKWSGKRPETPAAPAPANPRGRRVCLVHVHQAYAAAARIRGSGSRRSFRSFSGPFAKHFFGSRQYFICIKITDEQQRSIFRRVKFAVDRRQIFALVCGHLRLARRNLGIGMRAKQNFAQSLVRQETRLGALHFYFFQLLPPLTFELGHWKRRLSPQFIHQFQQR